MPLLLFRKARIDQLSGFDASDVTLYRLYGMAVLALLVGYLGGYLSVLAGQYPLGIVAMGLASNAGALAILVQSGRGKRYPWEAGFFGIISLGLATSLFYQDWFIAPL